MLIKIWMDDDVGNAGFIFHGKEYKAEGCTGALTGDDATGSGDTTAVRLSEEFFGAEDACGTEVGAAIGHGVMVDGESGAGVISDETFVGLHSSQG